MKTKRENINENNSISKENLPDQTNEGFYEYQDNRSVVLLQKKLQKKADNSEKTKETTQLQSIADKQFDTVSVAQKKQKKRNTISNLNNTIQLIEDLDNLNDESAIIEEKDARQKIREENPNLIEDDGSIAIICPSDKCGLTVEEIQAKDVPDGLTSYIIDTTDIPTDRSFRNAWTYTP